MGHIESIKQGQSWDFGSPAGPTNHTENTREIRQVSYAGIARDIYRNAGRAQGGAA